MQVYILQICWKTTIAKEGAFSDNVDRALIKLDWKQIFVEKPLYSNGYLLTIKVTLDHFCNFGHFAQISRIFSQKSQEMRILKIAFGPLQIPHWTTSDGILSFPTPLNAKKNTQMLLWGNRIFLKNSKFYLKKEHFLVENPSNHQFLDMKQIYLSCSLWFQSSFEHKT